jgi:hypothetical protein
MLSEPRISIISRLLLYDCEFRHSVTTPRMMPSRAFSMLAILQLFGWRWGVVSDAVSQERFPRASPVRKRCLLQLLKTEIFNLPWGGQSRSQAHQS